MEARWLLNGVTYPSDRAFLADSDILFARGQPYGGRKVHDTQHDMIKLQDVETRIAGTRISNQLLQHPSDGQYSLHSTTMSLSIKLTITYFSVNQLWQRRVLGESAECLHDYGFVRIIIPNGQE